MGPRSTPEHRLPELISIVIVAVVAVSLGGCAVNTEILSWLENSADHPSAPVLVVAAFVASGFVAAPLSAIMVPTILVFGPLHGSLWTLVGATASGALFFLLGARGGHLAERLAPRPIVGARLRHFLDTNGVLAVAMARLMPIAPYPIVNLALGASRLRLVDFLVGNLLGLLPWVILYAATGAQVRGLLAAPNPRTVLTAAFAVACLAAVSLAIAHGASRLFNRFRPTDDPPEDLHEDAAC
jgi:uncharacterized membrane protein YdjX (TVP38/TMEM64 family)